MIEAPWTAEQCAKLNAFQACEWMHPFTCGSGNRDDLRHRACAEERGGDRGQLVATPGGWICPACDYRQSWAHEFMFLGPPPNPFAAFADAPLEASPRQVMPPIREDSK